MGQAFGAAECAACFVQDEHAWVVLFVLPPLYQLCKQLPWREGENCSAPCRGFCCYCPLGGERVVATSLPAPPPTRCESALFLLTTRNAAQAHVRTKLVCSSGNTVDLVDLWISLVQVVHTTEGTRQSLSTRILGLEFMILNFCWISSFSIK